MLPLSEKIYNLLSEEGIQEHEMLEVLQNIYQNIYVSKYSDAELSDKMYNKIRDIVWYNIEHKSDNFSDWGSLFPVFMSELFNGTVITDREKIKVLLKELEEIRKYFNDDTHVIVDVQVLGEDLEDNTKVIVFDNNNKKTSERFSTCNCVIGNDIFKDKTLCIKINAFLDSFITSCEKARKSNLIVNFV